MKAFRNGVLTHPSDMLVETSLKSSRGVGNIFWCFEVKSQAVSCRLGDFFDKLHRESNSAVNHINSYITIYNRANYTQAL